MSIFSNDQLDRIEQKLDLIIEHLNIQSAPAQTRENFELEQLLSKGRKIEAIKRYRGMTGAGLKEAKAAIDALEVKLRRG